MSEPWTPGPWDYDAGDFTIYAQEETHMLFEPVEYGSVTEADARLIAAAPEMAELLNRCVDALALEHMAADDYMALNVDIAEDARSLLSRIRGEAEVTA